jgi:hypothetical protein
MFLQSHSIMSLAFSVSVPWFSDLAHIVTISVYMIDYHEVQHELHATGDIFFSRFNFLSPITLTRDSRFACLAR